MRNLAELAAASGVQMAAMQEWATAPCPEGVDPRVWADAQKVRAARARPWQSEPLSRLPYYMSGVLPRPEERPVESAAEAA